jgi:hypothetical protein
MPRVLHVALLMLASLPTGAAWSQAAAPALSARAEFLDDLSQALLQTDGQPLALGPNLGWRGVVLIPPGTALPSTMTPFDGLGTETMNVSVMLENASTFDRPLVVKDGTGHPSALSIVQIWQSVLQKTRPVKLVDDVAEGNAHEPSPWLYREEDAVDRIRGVRFMREPSTAMLRYREFESLYRVLMVAEQHDDGTWRLHPRLSQYGSIGQAKAALAQDWITYGYKSEVDVALAKIHDAPNAVAWRNWTEADAHFNAGRRFLDLENWVPQTLLFPPPSEWLGMGTWVRMNVASPDAQIRITCQIARVRIIRPWLALEDLLSGRLVLSRQGQNGGELSDGATPTLLTYPEGLMAVIPEELVLVRGIRLMRGTEIIAGVPQTVEGHPLARFSYPDATNLLAYVVRALPRTPR